MIGFSPNTPIAAFEMLLNSILYGENIFNIITNRVMSAIFFSFFIFLSPSFIFFFTFLLLFFIFFFWLFFIFFDCFLFFWLFFALLFLFGVPLGLLTLFCVYLSFELLIPFLFICRFVHWLFILCVLLLLLFYIGFLLHLPYHLMIHILFVQSHIFLNMCCLLCLLPCCLLFLLCHLSL